MNNLQKDVFVRLAGSGSYLPGNPVPADEVDHYLGELTMAPEKIQKWLKRIRSVMKELIDVEYYHFAIDPITRTFLDDNITMSVKASQNALYDANLSAGEIDLIVYASAHQDQMPTASVRIQEALGIEHCAEISVHANCTSAYKALMIASDMIRNGRYQTALVVSSGISSSELIAEYYNQPLVKKEELFLRYFLSDGAAAIILQAANEKKNGLFVEYNYIESIGGKKPSAMGNKRPAYFLNPREEYDLGLHHLAQMFQDELSKNFHEPDGSVFLKGLNRMLAKFPIEIQNIKYFQVNFPSKHIAELIMDECSSLGISRPMLYSKMASMGYIGPPMALLCLDKIRKEESLKQDDIILSFVTEVSKFMQAGYILRYR